MAVATEAANSGRTRKRKRTTAKRKLTVSERVEVRFDEDGFQGSWHPATVIACYNQGRRVKYDHLLRNDGSDNLDDDVHVSPVLDGIGSASENSYSYRGHIRPLPPPVQFSKWGLPYGLCVDVYYRDAWWEGVIFDHDDGSDERRVFFPDIGDELNSEIHMLRLSQDWNEVTENWQPRGTWLFLELIEEYEQEWYLGDSVKQIWYDLRGKKGFEKIKEWTCTRKDLWKELVWEVIDENLDIILKDVFQVLDRSKALLQEGNEGSEEIAGTADDADMSSEADLPHSAIIPAMDKLISPLDVESDMKPLAISDVTCHDKAVDFLGIPSNPDRTSRANSLTVSEDPSCNNSCNMNGEPKSLSLRKTGNWLPAGPDILPGAVFCPSAVSDYLQSMNHQKRTVKSATTALRMHLSYQGWKIECMGGKGNRRFRYTSPDGKYYYTLGQVCQDLRGSSPEMISSISNDQRSLHVQPDDPSSTLVLEQPEKCQDTDFGPQNVESPRCNTLRGKVEFCPQAVKDYYMHGLPGCSETPLLSLQARMHLLEVGWKICSKYQRGKRKLQYTSPRGQVYFTLRSACKDCMDGDIEQDEGGKPSSTATNAPSRKESTGSSSMSQSTKLPERGKVEVQETRTICMKRNGDLLHLASQSFQALHNFNVTEDLSSIGLRGGKKLNLENENANLPKLKRKNFLDALNKLRHDLKGSRPTRMLRSCKRARQVVTPSSSHYNPRTLLSWLIDNNVVFLGAKVAYHSRKNHRPMAEGWITREGIKCRCCQEVFTLSGFEVHAGSKYCRPSTSIFLEDGRSLLDCQRQIIHDNKMGISMQKKSDRMKCNLQGENDYICTSCHYGGELILCDQCPSSFHRSCINLKDIPDGDWFCPSCRCGICGQKKLRSNSGHLNDTFLTCNQCEHKYHVGCLRYDTLKIYGEDNWFCCKKCQQIYLGLHQILGKPIPVDNLTWTLLKPMSDGHDVEVLIQNYCKLSIALDVMHECFEPVKEPCTGRDLVEDVIFSRGSELNRLNFRGFHTVVLERNDEMIAVATVRIHGGKVAEIPLVATRFQYRQQGMCRRLMTELEKRLIELGVERLILPAISSTLNTWTTSFGFTKMTDSEKLQFLDCTFLNFPDTIMCQKLLIKNPPEELSPARGTNRDLIYENSDGSCLDVSIISEVYRSEQIDRA